MMSFFSALVRFVFKEKISLSTFWSHVGLEMSRVELNLSELVSIRIGSARNSTRVRYEPFFELEFDSCVVHEQLGSTR